MKDSNQDASLNNGQPSDVRMSPYLQQQAKMRGTPEPNSSDMSEDSSAMMKIPSYKQIPTGMPTMVGKNGNLATSSSPTARPVMSASPQQPMQSANLSVISPPLMKRSGSQSPPSLLQSNKMLSISDVIAKSISNKFQQETRHHTPPDNLNIKREPYDPMDQYKRPQISIKNLGQQFGNPNIPHFNASQLTQLSNTGTGGKGTRPKRGKYRNYDRDSLVEAVKAVQRGEMSVHRAGSYYGVPHSTLEYKVKERHLMRPRKREPKPQPLDKDLSSTSSSLGKDLSASSNVLRNLDKSKVLPMSQASSSGQKPQMKTPFPDTSPNGGLKMPIFDPAVAAQLQYTSPFLWPHHGFAGLPMDFARQMQGPNAAAEQLFASQMMQKFQDEQAARNAANQTPSNSGGSSQVSNKK